MCVDVCHSYGESQVRVGWLEETKETENILKRYDRLLIKKCHFSQITSCLT